MITILCLILIIGVTIIGWQYNRLNEEFQELMTKYQTLSLQFNELQHRYKAVIPLRLKND